jgi:hypothetical protein
MHSCFYIIHIHTGHSLGNGPPWRLHVNTSTSVREESPVCLELLKQALSSSRLADVEFVFTNSEAQLRGHWAVLCATCEVFRAMEELAMTEQQTCKVTVRDVSSKSFRAFLEWLYAGEFVQVCSCDSLMLLFLPETALSIHGLISKNDVPSCSRCL